MECPISQRMLRRIFHVHGSIPIQELDILLFLVTQVSVISIFVTQFSIWYHNGFSFFFQVKMKALKKKTQSKSICS